MKTVIRLTTLLLSCVILASSQDRSSHEQPSPGQKIVYTTQELQLVEQVRSLSAFPLEKRGPMIKDVALGIRRLPASVNKLRLADSLAFISTAGNAGPATLQEVATTLADALRDQPVKFDSAYSALAQLVHFEHVKVSLDDPRFAAAMSQLEADDEQRRKVDFTLADLHGKNWTLKDLRDNVVLVHFWASWSRPCRQEMIDIENLYQRFKKQNLVILAISSEQREQVENFVKAQKITLPVLLDPEQKVGQLYRVLGVPKSFVYNRQGKLTAQAIDVRTQQQLLNMLQAAGLQ
jgi:peroxiredoxin